MTRILVVNAGSSSLKLRVLDQDGAVQFAKDLPNLAPEPDPPRLWEEVAAAGQLDAQGHRIVHGGSEFTSPVLVDDSVLRRLWALADLAPLHQPPALRALGALRERLPGVPAVASFDTAFHASLPAEAATYALPKSWRERFALRRYGFHGLSHAYAARRAGEILGRPLAELRLVTCHLGAGASLAAVRAGVSVDTTMGFTPLEGLVMATRAGSLDPGLVLWLEEHVGTPAAELASTLEHRSGLLGLAGSARMQEVLSRARDGNGDAQLGLDVYLHRLRGLIACMAAAMDGLDALVFTGGVGENSPEIRHLACAGLGFLGVTIDRGRNCSAGGDRQIGSAAARVATLVVAAREDLQILQEVQAVLDGGRHPRPDG